MSKYVIAAVLFTFMYGCEAKAPETSAVPEPVKEESISTETAPVTPETTN